MHVVGIVKSGFNIISLITSLIKNIVSPLTGNEAFLKWHKEGTDIAHATSSKL